jgi:hypothetical protein
MVMVVAAGLGLVATMVTRFIHRHDTPAEKQALRDEQNRSLRRSIDFGFHIGIGLFVALVVWVVVARLT